MAAWNSVPLHVSYEVMGWFAFASWSISFYPQVILNFRRKSVVGLNFDFVLLNFTKHSSYLIYNASLYISSTVQKQYRNKYGQKERGSQKVSKIAYGVLLVTWTSAAVCFFVALHNHNWLWLISIFSDIQVCMTVIKYIPQAVMNFMRKSTEGWSIVNILLDFSGSVANYAQMSMQSIDQHSWVNFYGNIGKLLLSLVSVFFDILFMCQHYLLYPVKKRKLEASPERDSAKSSDKPFENV
ncbi:cystinosin homolog isoform X4 [Vigna umbellata]|uniref:cystinosin homolog isoform X3 n=1 Tax=Vigna umbellata TaxID=87088 RepID=UPI001F5E5CCA|nr:cystinosin homolog isoform X3 [Vigna umbellata]XP_047157600.1 cystinosin homolog isoform X4 [Vigna umbellata]